MRAKSAQPRPQHHEPAIMEEELCHQIKKSALVDGDRKEFWKQAEEIKLKNKECIDRIKQENIRLMQLRDQLTGKQKMSRTVGTTHVTGGLRDQNFWRRQLDKEKHVSYSKKKTLLHLQDLLREVEQGRCGLIQESPLVKNIRVLENRLDKVMIKYNEAQSIRKTYEQIVKRLKEERVGYDNQLAAIERSLKDKEHDFEELLLLAHDATHAKQVALGEHRKLEVKRGSVQDLRTKYLEEKKIDIDRKRTQLQTGQQFQQDSNTESFDRTVKLQDVIHDREKSNYEKEDLNKYEEAMRQLKEVTGVLDSNEIIQKYKTQELTAHSLEELKRDYEGKITRLKECKMALKQELAERLSRSDRNCDRQHMNSLAHRTNGAEAKLDTIKGKYVKLHKLLIDANAGLEHLNRHLLFFKREPNYQDQGRSPAQLTLIEITRKLEVLFGIVRNDQEYSAEYFKQSAVNIEQIVLRNRDLNEQLVLQRNNRLKKCHDEDDISDNELEEESNIQNTLLKCEAKPSNGNNRAANNGMRKIISKKF